MLSVPYVYFHDYTGQGSWVVALAHRKCSGMKRDELYIGTAEERAALKEQSKLAKIASGEAEEEEEPQGTLDKNGQYNVRAGHLYPGVPRLPPDFGHRSVCGKNRLRWRGSLSVFLSEIAFVQENVLKSIFSHAFVCCLFLFFRTVFA